MKNKNLKKIKKCIKFTKIELTERKYNKLKRIVESKKEKLIEK